MWGVDVAGGGVGRVVALGLIRKSLDDAGGGVRVVGSCCATRILSWGVGMVACDCD